MKNRNIVATVLSACVEAARRVVFYSALAVLAATLAVLDEF